MKSSNTVVVALAAVACTALVAVVALAALVPDAEDLVTLITIILTGAATLIGTILGVSRSGSIDTKVTDLTNGRMDAKIRAAVSEVLPDELIRPEMRAQLEEDKRRR